MSLEKVLPPGVNGKTSGHLTVSVDEVFWTKSSPGEIFVELLWWGEKEGTIFRPEDVTLRESRPSKETSVTYSIQTSPGLFETYLKNCGKVTFTILRGQNKNVIAGSVVVKDIHEIMTEKIQHAYYPIFNPKGLRIGDLHICFDLKFTLRQSHYPPKGGSEIKFAPEPTRRPISSKSSTSATSQEDKKLLSEILSKGNELRKAMMLSVLNDCRLEDIESVISCPKDGPPTALKPSRSKDKPKLVDFLLGKDMTPEDEQKAIETLRCISPDDNLLKLATTEDDSKVTKSVCCLHGKNCHKKNKNDSNDLRESSSPPDIISKPPHSASSSSDHRSRDGLSKIKEDETSPESHFNSYQLIVKTLDLTSDGVRKIHYAPIISEFEEQPKRVHHPPGTNFLLEIAVPSKGPWSRNLKFLTKTYKDKRIIFGQGTSHRLCGRGVSWARVEGLLKGTVFRVFWRHLNQRVPCPLGVARLDSLPPPVAATPTISLCLPLYTNTRLLTGHLSLAISLAYTRGGGEAMFRLEEKREVSEATTPLEPPPPQQSASDRGGGNTLKPPPPPLSPPPLSSSNSQGLITPLSGDPSSESSDDEGQPGVPQRKLDDELLRTINLLNSKQDVGDGKRDEPTARKDCPPVMRPLQEASVQTTPPPHPSTFPLPPPPPQAASYVQSRSHIPPGRSYADSKNLSPPEKLYRPPYEFHRPDKPPDLPPSSSFSTHGQYSTGSQPVLANAHPVSSIPPLSNSHYPASSAVPPHLLSSILPRSHPMYDDICHPEAGPAADGGGGGGRHQQQRTARQRLRVAPKEYNGTEKIHEFSVKIQRVLGVPLFTGDSDLDCYVDYSFPKVEPDGIMSMDREKMGTEVRIALRETEFGTVSRHRLRLSCSLTRALLSLPSSAMVFSLWGRYYSPTPRDYRIAKASLPLSRLSGLEMKYEQQQEEAGGSRQPVFESLVLALEPVSSSLTSGYSGPFGELHLSLGYSSASGLSYRQWRCESRGDHFWCQHSHNPMTSSSSHSRPNYECVRTRDAGFRVNENNDFCHPNPIPTHQNDNINCKPFNEPNADFIRTFKNPPSLSSGSFKNHHSRNDFVPVSSVGQNLLKESVPSFSNAQHDHRFVSGPSKGSCNENVPMNFQKIDYINDIVSNTTRRMQPLGASIETSSYRPHQLSKKEQEVLDSLLGSGKQENIVKKVLKDIEERKKLEKKLVKALERDQVINVDNNSGESDDAFKSFDLRVDLPQNNDASDFEVRSQYSFLKSPNGETSFPVNNCLDLESSSSDSIKRRLFNGEDKNPFESQSNVSFNSDASIFKPLEPPRESARNGNNEITPSPIPDSHRSKQSSLKEHCTERRTPLNNADSENDSTPGSSNGTLKSVESLKSYKDTAIIESKKVSESGDNQAFNRNNKYISPAKYFKARVEICRALGLPALEVRRSDGKSCQVKPTSHAYFAAVVEGKETLLRTKAVEENACPVWNSSWDVLLPVELLKESDRELEIFVELSVGSEEEEPAPPLSRASQGWPVLLRSGVDLTPITAGLAGAAGWYCLLDRALLSRAQIKVCVSPLEDVSVWREAWLKDYTASQVQQGRQGRRDQPSLSHRSSSIAASLQEKLFELEKLTERMKSKMSARTHWDESPPLSLLAEVQQTSEKLREIPPPPPSTIRDEAVGERAHMPAEDVSPIVISDDSDLEGSEDTGSYEVVNTYTVSQDSDKERKSEENEDSLETSSKAIDRIITRVRNKR